MRTRIATVLSLFVLALGLNVSAAAAQATASVCKDGTTSAVSGRGACSSHGGVDVKATEKMTKAAAKKAELAEKKSEHAVKKAEKAEDRSLKDATGAIAQCKDGTYSHAKTTRGACSRHGGIATKLKS